MNNTIINTDNLVKTYRRYKKQEGIRGSIQSLVRRTYEEKTAVNHISLSVQAGEFVGMIGPNGADQDADRNHRSDRGTIDVLGYYPNDLSKLIRKIENKII